jgi:hypothetical protein
MTLMRLQLRLIPLNSIATTIRAIKLQSGSILNAVVNAQMTQMALDVWVE